MLRDKLGIDLLNPQHTMQVYNSLTDQLTFVFLLVEDEAKQEGIDVDGFERRLMGDGVATEASIAFLEELKVFFQKFDQAVMVKMAESALTMRKKATANLNDLVKSGRFDSAMEQAMQEMDRVLLDAGGNTSQS